ncbi:hypothetical protein BD626DRAFT_390890 [Schizophyllum amplum]|uniref:Pentatricopeptide repeat-containing protein-mitochondrial domain-containing protein n=1 Tax=Schizophyllum amplum TaxID=97359 RepID=A0A550CXM5_9AGAR|nr:hypothetical protein BD626DRAFT_390890 [Auriculariopsis ampla]
MKRAGVPPDYTTYLTLARTFATRGLYRETLALLEDMEHVGLKPDLAFFHEMARNANRLSSAEFWKTLDEMDKHGVRPDAAIWTGAIQQFASAGNVELALETLYNVREDGLEPELPAAEAVVTLLCEKGYVNLALDVVDWFEGFSIRPMSPQSWMECLGAAAIEGCMDHTVRCWNKAVVEYGVIPDEGLCLAVLAVAARHGQAEFAISQPLTTIASAGITLSHKHIAPVIEAFGAGGNLRDAFTFLHSLPNFNLEPPLSSLEAVAAHCLPDIDAIDSAWATVDELHSASQLSIAALNTIILAAAHHSDLQRALGAYKSLPTYNLTPDTDTFNILLDACVAAQHRQLGDALLADVKAAGVPVARGTYDRMVRLCLTQPEYDDAFFYLNEMEAAGYVPPASLYEAIVRKCAGAGDTRYEIALEEMRKRKMVVSQGLMGEVGALMRRAGGAGEAQHVDGQGHELPPSRDP